MGDKQVFEAQFSRARIILLVVLSLCFCAAGLFLMGVVGAGLHVREPNIFSVAFGGVVVGFFGLMVLRYLSLLRKGRLAVRIDATGFLDRTVSDDPIPWEHLSDFRISEIRHERLFITFWTFRYIQYQIDPKYERKLTGFDISVKRILGIFNRGYTRLLHTTLDCDFEALTRALRTIPPKHARLVKA